MEQYVGKRMIDAVIVGPKADISGSDRVVIQTPLEASDVPYRHDRHLLREALEKAIQAWVNPARAICSRHHVSLKS
jgi:2-phospho-L-lactate transferase/gluconeogenesis factor (CofD/UPF0052 family)